MTKRFFLTKSSTPESYAYLQKVGEQHRKQFGQFFTHQDVANFMVAWVLGSGHTSLYDPGFGLGAFYAPVSNDRRVDFSASEIDPVVLGFWEQSTGRDDSFVTKEDYLLSWGKRHTAIVCNPPYMRFQKFLNRDAVFCAFAENTGLRLSGYTNIASAFLLKSLTELDDNGRLAYIMPLEFLNTGYGKLVKSKLIESGHLAAIIELDCERDIFPDAITSAGIILYDASAYYPAVDFYSLASIDSLSDVFNRPPVTRVPLAELSPGSKWLPYFAAIDYQVSFDNLISLPRYGRFSRGIATGANEFFTLRPSTAQRMRLDHSECLPCLTRSSQVQQAIFSPADYDRLMQRDAPVLLFSVGPNHSSAAEEYIRLGESNGYHQRFLTRNRVPWYRTEIRRPAPLLIGVFSRGGYKVVRNTSNAVNLTCFHGFQPNCCGQHYLDHLFLYFASRPGRTVMSLSARKYGAALAKFEPNDLNSAYVPGPDAFDKLRPAEVKRAISYIKETGCVPDYIDAFFGELVNL